MKRLSVLLVVAALAGCGGSAKRETTTTSPAATAVAGPVAAMRALVEREPALAGRLRMLFEGSGWSVVQSTSGTRASAVPFHLVHGRWQPDRVAGVSIEVLGPAPGDREAPSLPQIAMEITAHAPFVESALWVDGTILNVQGGGTPMSGTIFGAPAHSLRAGLHVAVGYARTATRAAAVAWTFDVR